MPYYVVTVEKGKGVSHISEARSKYRAEELTVCGIKIRGNYIHTFSVVASDRLDAYKKMNDIEIIYGS